MTTGEKDVITSGVNFGQTKSDQMTGHCLVLAVARQHKLLRRNRVQKKSCSKPGGITFRCIIVETISGSISGNYGEAGNINVQTEKYNKRLRAIPHLLFQDLQLNHRK